MKTNILLAVMLALTTISATASDFSSEIKAPFGLKWGEEKSAIKNLYNCESMKKTMTFCSVASPPKTLSDGEGYWLVFDNKAGLVKAGYYSKSFINDFEGRAAIKRFNFIKNGLTKKYPAAERKELISMHKKVYKEENKFYECLLYAGCGFYSFHITGENGSIAAIQINGLASGKGYISLVYESAKFSEAFGKNKKLNNKYNYQSI